MERFRNVVVEGYLSHTLCNLFPIDSLWVYHAVIVEEVSGETVQFLDPAQGKRQATIVAFEQAWQLNKRQAIVVSNKDIPEVKF